MIVNGDFNANGSSIQSLGKLKEVNEGHIFLRDCKNLKDLGNLEKIGTINLDILTENFSFNKVKFIQQFFIVKIKNCKQINIDYLEEIKNFAGPTEFWLYVKNLGKLKYITSFQFNLSIYDNIDFNFSNFGKVETIYGNLIINGSKNLKSLKPLKKVSGVIYLVNCPNLKDLGYILECSSRIELNNTGITKEYIIKNHPNLINKITWK